jgi:CubicO group peptidase (beta-lactamase class C family)
MSLQARVDAVVASALERQTIVGSVIVVMQNGKTVYRSAAGHFDREAGTPMREDAIFRLASFTKPLVAASALAMIERGLLRLDQPVTDFLPYFRPKLPDGTEPVITIHHLLTHTGGITAGGPDADAAGVAGGLTDSDLSLDENIRRLAHVPLLNVPGAAFVYGKGLDLLGGVLATIEGGMLSDVVSRYVTGPLGLSDTGFFVTDVGRLATVYADNPGGTPFRMEDPWVVPDRGGVGGIAFSVGRIFNPKAFQSGGAGGVGTAPDFIRFLEVLRNGGAPILSAETLARATRNQIGNVPRDPGSQFSYLGAVVVDSVAAATPQAAGTYEWGGIYGHRWFVDPVNAISAVIMTNTAVEGCSGPFPSDIRDAIYG